VFFREPMFDLDRKWAYFRKGRIESILTTVPLTFGWGKAIGIAGVATRLSSRGQGFAAELLREVLRSSDKDAEGPALLFAKQTEVYERVGFRVVDRVIRAPIDRAEEKQMEHILSFEQVESIYNHWASEDPYRLRRDERRWDYWKWNLRVCCPFTNGYVCIEGTVIRECILDSWVPVWPVHGASEWFGLESMANRLHIPIRDSQFELHLMSYGFDEVPQMFLTDQF
jgi:hypothetical protein